MGRTLIRKLSMKYSGIHNKTQQEIMHSILQEYLYHFDFFHVNIHLDKYNVHVININAFNNNNSDSQQQPQ